MKKLITFGILSLGIVSLAGCGQAPESQPQSTTPTSAVQEPVKPVTDTQEVALNKLTLTIPQDLKTLASKRAETVTTNGTQGSRASLESWLMVPSDFDGYDSKNPKQKYSSQPEPTLHEITIGILKLSKISFATLEVRDSHEGEVTDGIVDVSKVLDLRGGEYPDGLVISYTLLRHEVIGKNRSGDDVYGYDYIVNEASSSKSELQPVREFNGALWVHNNKVYILQDQTQAGSWAEMTIGNLESVVEDKIPSIALSSKIEDGQGENIHEQELSHTEHITQSLHNNFTIEEIDNPHLTLPSDINAGQIEKYFQIDNTLLALVLRGSMNVQITVPIDFTVTFAGVLVAQQGDSQWTKLIEIENTEVTTRNNPYYLVVDNQKLLLTIVDQNGAGSSEGIMKVFALSETSHWKLESCYYYGGSSDSFPDDDQFSFSARFSSFTPEPIGSCDNVELVFLTQ